MGWYKVEFLRDYLRLFWIHLICDPMEKIWVKNELYKERYEFLNFIDFFGFYFNFLGIFLDLIPLKKGAKIQEIMGSWST